MNDQVKAALETISTLQITADTAGLDAASKKVLSHKEVLAIILKDSVEEYADYSVEEIMEFIEQDSITRKEVSPGRTNTTVKGDNAEFIELNEKTSYFDVCFTAKNPKISKGKISVNLHIDIEPQCDYTPGYPIEKRGVYYLSRSMSSQLSLVTEKTDYNLLEKCYSIWICRDNIPKEEKMSISFYKMVNYRNIGQCNTREEDYDLLHLVIIRLGEEEYREKEDEKSLFEFLAALFYPHKKDFRKTVSKYIDVESELSLAEEVKTMDGLGMSILAEGIERGIEQGIEQGICAMILDNLEEGTSEDRICEKLCRRFELTKEQAEAYIGEYGKITK